MQFMKSYDIVGYTYAADVYCDGECVVNALTSSPQYQGWALAPGVRMSTEDNLNDIATIFGIDRGDEESFDSGDFPKIVHADQVDENGE